ncbi:MAG: glycosyltransferase family 2 protein [Thaumarchaeota archaeon]|nr:glycosyltransferase family 2 protein [Nitrososphaerota archaeon]
MLDLKQIARKRSIDIIVPEFNELSRQGERFDEQVAYLSHISGTHETFLVDDASTDGSWERMVELSPGTNPQLHLIRMKENGHKVLAIKQVLQRCKSNYVLLSDFDSIVTTPDKLTHALRRFEKEPRLASVALRLVPEGSSIFSKLQDLEYAIGRKVFGGYLVPQGKLRCVPGAAGIWRREILKEVLDEHSGRHNGDDLESTAIAMRKGYRIDYEPSIQVQTMVPQNARDFFKQRKRWALGSLETYDKERRFYRGQIRNIRSRLGHLTLFDFYGWFAALFSPLFIANAFLNHFMFGVSLSLGLAMTSAMCYVSRNEIKDKKELALIPFFPIYIFLATMPLVAALYEFVGARKSHSKSLPSLQVKGLLTIDSASAPAIAALQRSASRIS